MGNGSNGDTNSYPNPSDHSFSNSWTSSEHFSQLNDVSVWDNGVLPESSFVPSSFDEVQTNPYIGGVSAAEIPAAQTLGFHHVLGPPTSEPDGSLLRDPDSFELSPEFTDYLQAAGTLDAIPAPYQPVYPPELALDLGLSNALNNLPIPSFPLHHTRASGFVDQPEEVRDFENGFGVTPQFSHFSSFTNPIGSAPVSSQFNQIQSTSYPETSSGTTQWHESGPSTDFIGTSQSLANIKDSNSEILVNEPKQGMLLPPVGSFPCTRCSRVFLTEKGLK